MCLTRMFCTMGVKKINGSVGRCGAPINILPSTRTGETFECEFCGATLRLVYVAPDYYVNNIPVGGPKILKPAGVMTTASA